MALMYKIVGKIYNNRSKESIVEALQNWRLFLIVLGAGKNLKGGSKRKSNETSYLIREKATKLPFASVGTV